MNTIIGMFKSKTIWFNATAGILAFVNATKGELIPNEYVPMIIAVCNFILRFNTNKALDKK